MKRFLSCIALSMALMTGLAKLKKTIRTAPSD